MGKTQLVIFDFDDTILHLDVAWGSVREDALSAAADAGIEIQPDPHMAVLANELSKSGIKERIDSIFLQYEAECVENNSYVLFPGMTSLIKELRSQGFKMAIASGNHTETIAKILAALGILDSFDVICGRDNVEKNKPDPDQLVYIMEKLGMKADHTIFVGDSINDEAAARAAGIRYVKAETDKTVKLLRALLL